MKKFVCIVLAVCLSLSGVILCNADDGTQRTDSFGNLMIESFDNPSCERIGICLVAQNTDEKYVSQGSSSTKMSPVLATNRDDKISAGMKVDVGEIDLSLFEYFNIDVFSQNSFDNGSLLISFLPDKSADSGFDYVIPGKMSEGLNKIVFKKTQVAVKDKTASWSSIKAVKLAFIDNLKENVKPILYFDNFFAVSDNYIDILDGKLSEYAFGDVNRSGRIDVSDALLALQTAVRMVQLDDGQKQLCDVDASGEITAKDALLILQYYVGMVKSFAVGERPRIGEKSKYFSSTLTLEEGKSYAVGEYKQILNFKTPDANYTNIQGGYFDGTKFVCALTRGSMRQNNEVGIIAEYDKNGSIIKWSEQLNIEHGNNVTFVPKMNAYLVSHCQPGWNVYSFIDADTLKEISSGTCERDFFSMAYSPVLDKYASGFSAGQKVHTWNGDLTLLNEFDVTQPSSLSQGVFCDSEYIYFVRSHAGGTTFSELRIYDWNGQLKFQVDMPEWNSWSPEPEGINVIDGKIYVIARQNGITVYEIVLKEKEA